MMRYSVLLAASAGLALSLPGLAAPAAKPTYGSFGFDTAGMDKTVKPGDDFFGYADGNWAKQQVIPADKVSVGPFNVLDDLSRERTRTIIEAAAKAGASGDADAVRVGTYYTSYMDEAAIEKAGLTPLRPALDRIAALKSTSDVSRALGDDATRSIPGPFAVGVEQDPKNPENYMVGMAQGGLGMPDRDYFLVDTPKFAAARTAYVKHIANMFRLAGYSDPEKRAQGVFDLEHDIAKVHWTNIENRDPDKTYNLRSPASLAAEAPGVDWAAFLDAAGVAKETRLDIGQPSAFTGMAKLVAERPIGVWQDYLVLRLLKARAGRLPKAFVDENFAFNGTTLYGQPENQARWKRGVNAVNDGMGEAVGKLYVTKYFTPKAKAEADALVANLLKAMGARIDGSEWMTATTKAQARAKLATFNPKIGYPTKWRDYTALEVRPGDAVGNYDRAQQFEYQRNLAKLGGPLDRGEWGMTPMEINAYYNPAMNEIVFPAAILQPPFFDPNADPAINYGGIGVVIGHEISHGFDDQGRKYDAKGKLTDWWTPADGKAFDARAAKLVAQYDAYEPLLGTHVKGALTLGENIADISGLRIAYDAYHLSLKGKPAPVIDGMTGDQRFFLGFAQVWREKLRNEILLALLTSNPHSPGNLRATTVRNFDPWYDAFGVKPGDKLYLAPADRVKIW